MKTKSLFLGALVLVLLPVIVEAQIPRFLSYQGVLTDTLGNPKPDGVYTFTFRLYETSTGGSPIWTEIKDLQVTRGLLSTLLGDPTPFGSSVQFDRPYWLGVKPGSDPELTPRTPLASVGYSFSAIRADTAAFALGTGGGPYLPLDGGTMTGAITNSGNPPITMGKGNFGTGNINSGAESFVAGSNNRARGFYSVVGGGGGPTPFDSNSALGDYSTVSGGSGNKATVVYATVGGGFGNAASGGSATVGGGFGNTAGNGATVGGGASNTASGPIAAVGGGQSNTASGSNSTVPGGIYNSAAGDLSFAAGCAAKANHSGAVVIAANPSASPIDTVASGDIGQMVLRANGGFYLTNTSGVASMPGGYFLNTSTGGYLSTGGAWTNSSDRNVKENFEPVNSVELLRKLSNLPISQWNYKKESPDIKHIGPMAQDFYTAFGLGNDDKTISTVDPAGIALAAIKELYKLTTQLVEKSLVIDDLKARVNNLEQMVQTYVSEHRSENAVGSR